MKKNYDPELQIKATMIGNNNSIKYEKGQKID
jgi:hypothetical protein